MIFGHSQPILQKCLILKHMSADVKQCCTSGLEKKMPFLNVDPTCHTTADDASL